ncbi:hypothetical protein MLD38_005955 [Melastoma candidum]|uniref:Uncharacterized protein n=1 Tax=Melastoma candidum TaxID=119954 RepID=A0ACB9RNA0_9MYRT|nr:hypothetical protein MLD38_005955 [Melastoma candidum]
MSHDSYVLHTKVFTEGKGNREQQLYTWLDPSNKYILIGSFRKTKWKRFLWNSQRHNLLRGSTRIRHYSCNMESTHRVPFPKSQPMWIYSSLWNADHWATWGRLGKNNWNKPPRHRSYHKFNASSACVWSLYSTASSCTPHGSASWMSQTLDTAGLQRMRWVQKSYMIYKYCSDYSRFQLGLPPEPTAA